MSKRVSMKLKVGNDNGNSEHDIIINGKLIKQPNLVAKVRQLPKFASSIDNLMSSKNDSKIFENLIVSVKSDSCEDGIYYIGEYAIKSGKPLKSLGVNIHNDKARSDIPIVNTVSTIAGFAVEKAMETVKDVEEIEVGVDMATALPVNQYTSESSEYFAKRFTDCDHYVKVHLSSREIKVKVKFNFVKVFPEGISTIFYLQSLGTNDPAFSQYVERYKKPISGEDLRGKKILHVAIGEGTTEYPLTKDIRYDFNFIEGTNNGVGHAVERILPRFMKEKFLQKFSRQDFIKVLRSPKHKYHKFAYDLALPELENEASEIMRQVKEEMGRANNDVDYLVIYGGGSILMNKFILPSAVQLCEQAEVELMYLPPKQAVVAEAHGLYAFVKSQLFSAIKRMSIERNKR